MLVGYLLAHFEAVRSLPITDLLAFGGGCTDIEACCCAVRYVWESDVGLSMDCEAERVCAASGCCETTARTSGDTAGSAYLLCISELVVNFGVGGGDAIEVSPFRAVAVVVVGLLLPPVAANMYFLPSIINDPSDNS